jgi:hypothetical protein
VPVRKLVQILLHVLRRNVVESPMNRPFQLRPERFHAVGMDDAAHKFLISVIHTGMVETEFNEVIIACEFIRKHCGTEGDFGGYVWNQSCGLAIGDSLGINIPAPFKDTGDGSLASRPASTFAGAFAADISFVGFNDTFEQISLALHKLANLMVDAPCGFVGDAGLTHEFHSGNTIAAGRHKEHGVEPSSEGSGRLMEDRSARGRDLFSAPRASEGFTIGDRIKAIGLATFASSSVWKSLVEKIEQAGRIIGELPVEILNRIFNFHVQNIKHELLVVKG